MTRAQKAFDRLISSLKDADLPVTGLGFETWSPRDGRTRYRITSCEGSRNVTQYVLGISAFVDLCDNMESLLTDRVWTKRKIDV